MKRTIFALTTLALGTVMISQVFAADAPNPTPPVGWTKHQGDRVRGKVTAVDTDKKTITVIGRDQTPVTIKVDGATKFHVSAPGTTADLKVGQDVRIFGDQIGDTTYEASVISVMRKGGGSQGQHRDGQGPGSQQPQGQGPGGQQQQGQGPGGRPGALRGVIATVTPAITLTSSDNKTLTIDTTSDTHIMTSKDGGLGDVKVDSFIMAQVSGQPGSQVAKDVEVRPAGMGGQFGGGQGGHGQHQGGGGAQQ